MSADKRTPEPLTPSQMFNQLNETFGTRKLARLLHTRTSHLLGYSAGELPLGGRRTERLEVLHDVVDGLKGSYNPLGINQWFDRKRGILGQHSPRYVLESYPWRKSDRPVRHITKLARDTAASPAT